MSASTEFKDNNLYLDRPFRRSEQFHTSLTAEEEFQIEERMLFPTDGWLSRTAFQPRVNWEGVVISVSEEVVVARIHPRGAANDDRVDEIEFDLEQVPHGDQGLVVEGALFYLSLGKVAVKGGAPQSSTSIVFRRTPAWTAVEIACRDNLTEELLSILRD